ncbi:MULTISPECIES: isochorismate synthase [Sporosarcina]|uniref:isochorismate synthase n=1 Tax=Sporosarcina TaxID=1569 RepID=UPI00058BC9E4|nr:MULTISPECIES: isochorismate synthase [Sporosarcina]WJY27815.1 isochorismate synthase [Sporosarcina sp. 0.2-SM1T-5]
MNRKLTELPAHTDRAANPHIRFFTETIEAGGISPLSFFEAGSSIGYAERFFWENASKTLTLVGIGHALTLTADAEHDRFGKIEAEWKQYCTKLIKEEKDMDPILAGGFSFTAEQGSRSSEWGDFPRAFFSVPVFQLKIENGRTAVAINLITDSPESSGKFDELRQQRDRLIHEAQMRDSLHFTKPSVLSMQELGKDSYLDTVTAVTGKIAAGEADKVVIARSLALQFDEPADHTAVLQSITNEQRDSYLFGIERGSQLFFGATPERLVEIKDGRAYSACVAGSSRRGTTAEEDRKLGEALLADKKNREEHHYVVEMITRVFDSLCASRTSAAGPKLMKVRDIQHLYTPVEGTLVVESSIFQFIKALHPTPALGGVPTATAMDIIRHEEKLDRGFYAAPVGWTDASGNGEFAVAIRSALLEQDKAWLYAGGGIVADSKADEEYEETWVKFRPMLRALGGTLHG